MGLPFLAPIGNAKWLKYVHTVVPLLLVCVLIVNPVFVSGLKYTWLSFR